MSFLPDELWFRIFETGATTGRLTYRDFCCLSIACRRLRRLSCDHAIWTVLLAQDFPSSSSSSEAPPSKSLYKSRFERDKERRLASWRRSVLRAESQVVVCKSKSKELESSLVQEQQRLKNAEAELNRLENVRRSSVALNVWQPEIIRGRHQQIVQQNSVSVESRINSLKMEVRVCKQQIATLIKSYDAQKEKLNDYKEAVASLKYHPLQSNSDISCSNKKRRRLKQNSQLKKTIHHTEQEKQKDQTHLICAQDDQH